MECKNHVVGFGYSSDKRRKPPLGDAFRCPSLILAGLASLWTVQSLSEHPTIRRKGNKCESCIYYHIENVMRY